MQVQPGAMQVARDDRFAALWETAKELNGEEVLSEGDAVGGWKAKLEAAGSIEEVIKVLDAHLSENTFLSGSSITSADVYAFTVLEPHLDSNGNTWPSSLRRFVRTVKKCLGWAVDRAEVVGLSELAGTAPAGALLGEIAKVKQGRDAGRVEKKVGEGGLVTGSGTVSQPPRSTNSGPTERSGKKKKAKDVISSPKEAGHQPVSTGRTTSTTTTGTTETSSAPSPSRLDIRVGYIKDAKKHPDADSLFIETIDVGDDDARTIVSGLVGYFSVEELVGRHVLVLCNLKPAKMRGVVSHGMVLVASKEEGDDADHDGHDKKRKKKLELLSPAQGSQPGDRVFFQGIQGDPDPQLPPKKKIWESIQPHLNTSPTFHARYKDVPMMTGKGPVGCESMAGAGIS